MTGGAGFIGSHLVDRLVAGGWYTKIIDNFSSGRWENLLHHKDNQNVEVVRGDLRNFKICMKIIEDVEVVFHFAANPEVRVSTIHPKVHFDNNVVTTFNLLEAIRQKGSVKALVFASSSSVYGEPESIPVDESAPLRPVSIYGASKVACESLIHAYCELYGIRTVILRYANVIGPRLRHGVVFDFVCKLRRNPRKLEILGDGSQVRSYLHVSDAVEAALIAYKELGKHFEELNVGNVDWITVKDVAALVSKALGLSNVTYTFKPVLHGVGWPGDVKRICLSIERMKSKGWKPTKNSRIAVMLTAKDLNKELNEYESRTP